MLWVPPLPSNDLLQFQHTARKPPSGVSSTGTPACASVARQQAGSPARVEARSSQLAEKLFVGAGLSSARPMRLDARSIPQAKPHGAAFSRAQPGRSPGLQSGGASLQARGTRTSTHRASAPALDLPMPALSFPPGCPPSGFEGGLFSVGAAPFTPSKGSEVSSRFPPSSGCATGSLSSSRQMGKNSSQAN
jgi:hypothetical protein